MSGLREELSVAPREGTVGSAAVGVVFGLLWCLVAAGFPLPARIALGGLIAFLIFLYGFFVSYVYGDAKRRGMRYRLWAVVAAVVPNALGFIAYFLLREPLLRTCGACGASARRDFAFCAECGSPLAQACPACRRPVDPAWTHCAHCGTRFGSPSPAGA
jgi:Double zinc ribbon